MVITNCVLETLVIAATTPPTFAVIADTLVGKSLPVIVTDVPGAPVFGKKPVIDGAAPPGGPVMVDRSSHHCWAGGMFQNLLPKNSRLSQPLCPAAPGPWYEVPEGAAMRR